MKSSLIVLVIALVLAAPAAEAAGKKKKTVVKTTTTTTTTEISSAPAPEHGHSGSSVWTPSAAFGLGSIGSRFHLGVQGKYTTRTHVQGTPLETGIRTGFLLSLDTLGGWVIPVTATATYEISNGGGLRPYIGVDLGIAIFNVSRGGFSNTSVEFTGLLVPGVHINEKTYLELPFGTIGGAFTLLPSVGMKF